MLERKRDVMAKLLTEVGFKPVIPQGGYFMMADTSGIGTITQFFVVIMSSLGKCIDSCHKCNAVRFIS